MPALQSTPDLSKLFSVDTIFAVDLITEVEGSLFVDEEALVEGAVAKRKLEFRAGRVLARRCLQSYTGKQEILRRDDDRVVCWPAGYVGSISHSGPLCAVAVARESVASSIGLDIEPDEAVEEEIWNRICNDAELEWAGNQPDETGSWVRRIFAAKEALYKCRFPLERRRLEFHEVSLSVDENTQTMTASVADDDTSAAWHADNLSIRYATFDGWFAVGATIGPAGD